jgi:Dyp-type peroxidase family
MTTTDVPEPVLELTQIQGNILEGFNKPFQTLLFLRVPHERVAEFREWLRLQVPYVATAAQVHTFKRLYKATGERNLGRSRVSVTWLNLAFSHAGLVKLAGDIPGLLDTDFTDEAFVSGMASRAERILGDPSDENAEANPRNWRVGGPDTGTDVVLIIASDRREETLAETDRLLRGTGDGADALPDGIQVVFREEGATLPAQLAGHEHFGFRDGVSQPGIRGRVSERDTTVLTPRQNPANPEQGKPGQELLWPGEFVFGYLGQATDGTDITRPGPAPVSAGPDWAGNGSYLVFRRLRQDVAGFHQFLTAQGTRLGMPPVAVGANLVGRWPSGAPLLRTPNQDCPALGADDCANNDFEFNGDPGPATATPPRPPGGCTDPFHGLPKDDPDGRRCPFTAHIRKAYPRNDKTPAGPTDPDASEVDTQTHRLLRRGIPYGPVSRSTIDHPDRDDADRGLHFLGYQTSIVDQFEFVTRNWVNNPNFSAEAAAGHACAAAPATGHDPIIGQDGTVHTRHFVVNNLASDPPCHQVSTGRSWVIPTGGEYFFAPSIQALDMLAGTGQAAG